MKAKLIQCRNPNAAEESLKADVRQMMRLDRSGFWRGIPLWGILPCTLSSSRSLIAV